MMSHFQGVNLSGKANLLRWPSCHCVDDKAVQADLSFDTFKGISALALGLSTEG